MTDEPAGLEEVVSDLLDAGGSKQERIRLLRELVRQGETSPESALDSALQRLMDRLLD